MVEQQVERAAGAEIMAILQSRVGDVITAPVIGRARLEAIVLIVAFAFVF
jgi:hypothetical protein